MMTRGSAGGDIFLVFMGVVLGIIAVCVFLSRMDLEGSWQEEAVKADHAEYYLDKDFQRQWRWLPVVPLLREGETMEYQEGYEPAEGRMGPEKGDKRLFRNRWAQHD